MLANSPRFTSYINNLHPQKYQELYKVIEGVVEKAIPLWNMTLNPLKNKHVDPTNPFIIDYSRPPRIEVVKIEFEPDDDLEAIEDANPIEEDEENWAYDTRLLEARTLIKPDAGIFQPPPVPESLNDIANVDLRRDYGDRGLQIIVKLANIELTPESPEYEGGTCKQNPQPNSEIKALI
jgi:Protein of unknown function (DUF4246)